MTVKKNVEKKGIELYFNGKPSQEIRDILKNAGFRWHSQKKCWYAKESEKTLDATNKVNQLTGTDSETIVPPQNKEPVKDTKALYENELKNRYENRPDIVKEALKNIASVVEIEDGSLIPLEKPRIKKDFCFGYSLNKSDSEDYDNANNMVNVAKSNQEYFISENLEDLNKKIDKLENNNDNIIFDYYLKVDDEKIKELYELSWSQAEQSQSKYIKVSDADKKKLAEGYKEVREDFIKRLNTYLKKYGLKNVHSWSYWQDA